MAGGGDPARWSSGGRSDPATSATSASDVDSTNYAFFAQGTYRFSDIFSLTAGLRWTNDELSYVHTRAPGRDLRTGLPATGPGVVAGGAGGAAGEAAGEAAMAAAKSSGVGAGNDGAAVVMAP